MKQILMILALLLLMPLASAKNNTLHSGIKHRWQYETTDNMGNKFYLDPDTLKRDGDVITYEEKTVYGPHLHQVLSQMFKKPVVDNIGSAQIDCKNKTVQRWDFKFMPITAPDMLAVCERVCKLGKLKSEE